ncbi:hypothetical protein EJ04DRAFT_546209 [Polyplosphaeria fusca]|uniref:Uncharacterized protein n=1 Tax=Polyplosphaeria fusca TaxID=682080 RepID=A0A9P4QNK6_9PLEO|nr:hypothetical protein EJ04DRAFT_546209 [Polyplosphaeria fusca]
MIATFIIAILLAFGQHRLYKSLHHTSEPDEGKRIRVVLYGRALAYFSKVAFGTGVILSIRQRTWRALRDHAFSVWSIDQLFLATEDPSLFVNWETLGKAPIVVALALIVWLIPLATIIFSPGALTFGDFLEVSSDHLNVPTLNFTAESYKDFRKPVVIDGIKKRSLLSVNTTDVTADTEGWFDYYDKPSVDLQRVSLMTAYSLRDQSLNVEDARQRSCGGDFNCTFTISFVGPSYKCEELARGEQDDQKLADAGAPWTTAVLAPVGRLAYIADVYTGEYARPQLENLGEGGKPENITDDLGFFKAEPVLWIGFSIDSKENLTKGAPHSDTWITRYDPHVFRCVHYETNYTVGFNYSGPYFETDIKYDYLSPVINTTISRNPDTTLNNPEPATSYISPRTDVPLYKKTAAYHALGQQLRQFLSGRIELQPPIPGPFFARAYSDITMTRLVTNTSSTPKKDLIKLVPDFYADIILSFFSAPQMLVVSSERVFVNQTRYRSAFKYDALKLWACYTPVIVCVFVALVIGAWTIWEDGTTFSVGFSRIMVTTRNSTLDHISRGACLGNDPFPMELMQTRLKFGVLAEHTEELEYVGMDPGSMGLGHCTFGVESELDPIVKGRRYAGLRYPRIEAAAKLKTD